MGFITFEYLALLPLCALLYRVLPLRLRAVALVALSYAFYLTWDVRMAAVMFGSTLLVFAAGLWIGKLDPDSRRGRTLVGAAVAALVVFLSGFKIAEALAARGEFVLPLGVSYYTFKLISYVVDLSWGGIQPERSFLQLAAYVSFFPQIVAGPIQRSGDFLDQLHHPEPSPNVGRLLGGAGRILLGCFKKLVVAESLGAVVAYAFDHVGGPSASTRLIAFYVFPIQLLADFSALTDISVGAARLFGLESPENFNAPFSAVNISDFWRRWHMSLTEWLRDYVFTPARMAWRAWGNAGLAAALTLNMVLIGLWHGLTLPFLAFGLIHSVFLIADALTSQRRKKLYKKHPAWNRATNLVGPLVTYHMVALGNVFFRAHSFSDGLTVVTGLYSGLGVGFGDLAPFAGQLWGGLAGYAAMEGFDYCRRNYSGAMLVKPRSVRWSAVTCALLTFLCLLAILLTRHTAVQPFVYAIF